jgi:glycosyltransferase involved in cell wall biosynthesis
MKSKTFYIIGNFGFISKSIDGQTVKTRNLKATFESIGPTDFYNTEKGKEHPLSIISIIFKIPVFSSIVVALNTNGIKYLVPLIFFWSRLFKKKLYFVAIGGWLADFVKHHKLITLILKKFDKIFVESKAIVYRLEECGYKNARYLFNFKTFDFERYDFSVNNDRKNLRMIFLSRVMWKKGIDIVGHIAETIDKEKYPLSIDIYGPLEETSKNDILNMISKYACLTYRGLASPDEVHKTMSEYDVLLFPTHWDGECFAGVILDAFIAGIPIIASDWKYNAEFVTDDVGFLFDLRKEQKIIDIALNLHRDSNILKNMKINAYKKRDEYSIDKAKEILITENVI